MRGEQHRVAEDVARHVAHSDDGEVRLLNVHSQLAEVALHRLPPALRGDAHRLVVVARAPARRERVAEPEVIFGGDGVGDVGEGRGSLVRGDDEIRIVGIVSRDPRRRDHFIAAEIVREIEHPAQQRLVAFDAFALECGPIS